MDDKLPGDITWKRVVMFMTCVIRDVNKFYWEIFVEHSLHVK